MEQVRRYAAANDIGAHDEVGNDAAGWFALGDRDLGTHLYRTSRRRAGASLSEVTAEIIRAWGLGLTVLPVSDDPLRTVLSTADGRHLAFQEYFVREQHSVAVRSVEVVGAPSARPAPGVLGAIGAADVVVVAPVQPRRVDRPRAGRARSARRGGRCSRPGPIAISPIVGGAALKGPADRLLRELGHEASVTSIARWYAPLSATLVIDEVDAALADAGRRPPACGAWSRRPSCRGRPSRPRWPCGAWRR